MGELLVVTNMDPLARAIAKHAKRAWTTTTVRPTWADHREGARTVEANSMEKAGALTRELDPDIVVIALELPTPAAPDEAASARKLFVDAHRTLAWATANKGARLLLVSSARVFDAGKGWSVEDDPVQPRDEVGQAYAAAEDESRKMCRSLLHVRLPPLVSARRDDPVFAQVERALRDEPAALRADVRANYLHVDEAGRLLVEMLERALTGTYHLGSAHRLTEHDLGSSLLLANGGEPASLGHAMGPGAPMDLSLNPEKALRNLGESPRSVFEGMERWARQVEE